MGLFLTILSYVVKLLPHIFSLVQTGEVAFSGVPGASGVAKKNLAMGVIQASIQASNMDPAQATAITSAASVVVDAVVGSLNAVGVFKKDNSSPTTTVVIPPSPTP